MLCQHCGKPIVGPRKGGQRKRFCNATCRGRWHRSRGAGEPEQARISSDQRFRDLEALYQRLLRDIETEGTLIPSGQGGALKGNPSAVLLVRVAAELERLEAARAMAEHREEVGDGDDIGAALRAVS